MTADALPLLIMKWINAIEDNDVLQVNGNLDEFLFDLFGSEKLYCWFITPGSSCGGAGLGSDGRPYAFPTGNSPPIGSTQ